MKDWTEELDIFEKRINDMSVDEFMDMIAPWFTPEDMVTDKEADVLLSEHISELYEE